MQDLETNLNFKKKKNGRAPRTMYHGSSTEQRLRQQMISEVSPGDRRDCTHTRLRT